MFDLIFALLGWNSRSPSYRYGNKSYDVDLEDGYIQQQPPSPDSVNRDYFRQNAPSALKSNSPYVPQDPYGRQYRPGEEDAAANGVTTIAVLLIVLIVGLFCLYMFNPSFHLLVSRMLVR